MLPQDRSAEGREVDRVIPIRELERHETAIAGFLPDREMWTGCVPCFHCFLISSFPRVQPFKQAEDKHFNRIIYNCVCGHVHPAIASLLRDPIAFAMRSASLPTPTTVAELIAYR